MLWVRGWYNVDECLQYEKAFIIFSNENADEMMTQLIMALIFGKVAS